MVYRWFIDGLEMVLRWLRDGLGMGLEMV